VIQADVTCSLFNVDAENLGVSSAWAERKSKCLLEAVSAEQEYRSQGFTGERDKYSIPIASDLVSCNEDSDACPLVHAT
jgi:hypothetical protein